MLHDTPTIPRKRQKMYISTPRLIAIKRKSQRCCWYCGTDLSWDISGEAYSIDHVIPVCNGGTNEDDNLVWCCRTCNQSKGRRSVEEFRVHRMKKLGLATLVFAFEANNWS